MASALREAKACLADLSNGNLVFPSAQLQGALAALVAEIEAAPVGVVEVWDTPEQWHFVMAPDDFIEGQRVRLLPEGE